MTIPQHAITAQNKAYYKLRRDGSLSSWVLSPIQTKRPVVAKVENKIIYAPTLTILDLPYLSDKYPMGIAVNRPANP